MELTEKTKLTDDELRYLRLVKIVNTLAPEALRLAFPRMWDERHPDQDKKWSDVKGDGRKASGKLLLEGDRSLELASAEESSRDVWLAKNGTPLLEGNSSLELASAEEFTFDTLSSFSVSAGDSVAVATSSTTSSAAAESSHGSCTAGGGGSARAAAGDEGASVGDRGQELANDKQPFVWKGRHVTYHGDLRAHCRKGCEFAKIELDGTPPRSDWIGKLYRRLLQPKKEPSESDKPLLSVVEDIQFDADEKTTTLKLQRHCDLNRFCTSFEGKMRSYAGGLVLKVWRILPPTDGARNQSSEDAKRKIEEKGLAKWDISLFNWAISSNGHGLADDDVRKSVSVMATVRNEEFGHAVGGQVDEETFEKAKTTYSAMLDMFTTKGYLKYHEKDTLRTKLEGLEKETFHRFDLEKARQEQLRMLIPKLNMRSPESLKKLLEVRGLAPCLVDEVTKTLEPPHLATLVALGEGELSPRWSDDQREKLRDIRGLLHKDWLLPCPATSTTQQRPAQLRKLSARQMQRAQKVRSARCHCTPPPSASLLALVPFAAGLGHRARSGQRACLSADVQTGPPHHGHLPER